jgi:hypothetical protein
LPDYSESDALSLGLIRPTQAPSIIAGIVQDDTTARQMVVKIKEPQRPRDKHDPIVVVGNRSVHNTPQKSAKQKITLKLKPFTPPPLVDLTSPGIICFNLLCFIFF